MNLQDKHLIIFDVDGTLADRDTDELLPGVAEWFAANKNAFKFAFVSNQGGVGLRIWMEEGDFGEPENFPTEEHARAHLDTVRASLCIDAPIYVCFRYLSKKGNWSPHPGFAIEGDPEWAQDHRKPAAGMIFRAIKEAGTTRAKTLLVGDSEEDRGAAINAEVEFLHRDQFFGSGLPF